MNETTNIVMVPVCGGCGHPINREIGIDKIENHILNADSSNPLTDYLNYTYRVRPFMCPNCNSQFTGILVPTEEGLYKSGYDANLYL